MGIQLGPRAQRVRDAGSRYGSRVKTPFVSSRTFAVLWAGLHGASWAILGVGASLVVVTVVAPLAIWPDWFGGPLALTSFGLAVVINFAIAGTGNRAYLRNGLAQLVDVVKYLRRSFTFADGVLLAAMLAGAVLLVWVFASGNGNLFETVHGGRYLVDQSGHTTRAVQEVQWIHLSAVTNVWTPVAISFLLSPGSLLELRANRPVVSVPRGPLDSEGSAFGANVTAPDSDAL